MHVRAISRSVLACASGASFGLFEKKSGFLSIIQLVSPVLAIDNLKASLSNAQSMNRIFSEGQERVIIERKVLVAKRPVRNPNDKRIACRPGESLVLYLPITKDLATRLKLSEGDYLIAEVGKCSELCL